MGTKCEPRSAVLPSCHGAYGLRDDRLSLSTWCSNTWRRRTRDVSCSPLELCFGEARDLLIQTDDRKRRLLTNTLSAVTSVLDILGCRICKRPEFDLRDMYIVRINLCGIPELLRQ